ncbi:MAG: antibiotic biosynthesis monooxygenase [Candidatus Nanopelagicales bacterium]
MTIAVIFSSTRSPGYDREYAAMATRMEELATQQPGYLGLESVRDEDGRGITVSYWESDEDAQAWKQVAEHLQAQDLGRQRFYTDYRVVVAQVTREYRFPDQ